MGTRTAERDAAQLLGLLCDYNERLGDGGEEAELEKIADLATEWGGDHCDELRKYFEANS